VGTELLRSYPVRALVGQRHCFDRKLGGASRRMIEFRHVTKRFSNGTVAVEDLNLVIPSRKTTVLVGSSGSGKTTLLRMVNRMVDPTSGSVFIDNVDISTLNPVALRRRVGYVMQNSGLLPHRTVIDNVATVPVLTGMSRKSARAHALDLLDTVGLDHTLANRYPSELSGGQQQRVGVARGLAIDPNILLMDEPFGAVDPLTRAELQRELLRLQGNLDKTILFVTHDIDEALLLGHQIVIMRTGGIVAQTGSAHEILTNPADSFVASFVGVDRGKRSLRVVSTDHGDVVVDGDGRAAGVIVSGSEREGPGSLPPGPGPGPGPGRSVRGETSP